MKLSRIAPLSFRAKIIDAHAHLGDWKGKKFNAAALDTFSKEPLPNGDTIEKMIVSDLSCLDSEILADEAYGNEALLRMIEGNDKYAPLAACSPKTGNVRDIKALFKKYPDKFIGLKFHPDEHEIMASDELLEPYLKFAQKNNLPCLLHCGIKWENGAFVDEARQFSAPEEVYAAAKKIPNTPVIMAHLGAGGEAVHKKAIDVLLSSIENNDAKLYADISWVDIDNPSKPTIVETIKKLQNTSKGDMTHRLLFGSDAPIAEFAEGKDGMSGLEFYNKTVVDIKNAIRQNFDNSDEIIDKIFYKNAQNLFFERQKPVSFLGNIKKHPALAIGACTLLGAGAALLINKIRHKTPDKKV